MNTTFIRAHRKMNVRLTMIDSRHTALTGLQDYNLFEITAF